MIQAPPPHHVKTPHTATHLDAPEITEASNLAEVLLWLDEHLDGYDWHPRHVRKGAGPPADAECYDLHFAKAADAAGFKFHWAGRMRGGEQGDVGGHLT